MMKELIHLQWRFLTFRPLGSGLLEHRRGLFRLSLVFTWLAGVGRYWDNPKAEWWQTLGFGSLAYVVVLALVLFLVISPVRAARWSYSNVLLFVMLTSLPAVLYAIPVERFLTPEAARQANAWFLGVVAIWRVALLVHYLRRTAKLSAFSTVVCTLLPLTAIVTVLALLNLEHVVFNLMSGIQEPGPNDTAYEIVVMLTFLSFRLLPFLALGYVLLLFNVGSLRGNPESEGTEGP